MMKKLIFKLSILLFISGCSHKKMTKINYKEKFDLPGVVEVTDNFYCDKIEVTNTHWCEFSFWTSRIYGSKSKE